jgi:LCP family protein required for cell wall assembly
VLVTGSDTREGLSAEERRALTTGSAAGERSDTIIVLSVSGTQAGLLSIPRDLVVERCDGSTGRINGAVGIGGPGCLVTTVRALTGLDVAHHVEVTFGGFRDVVDAVGGVEVCLERAIRDRSAGIDLPAGCQRLDGADALGYVRVRKVDSDLFRIQRQQLFLRALAAELTDPARLARPWQLPRVVAGTARAVTVDRRLGPVSALRLAPAVRALGSGTAVTATLPTRGATRGGAAVQVLVEDEAAALLAAWRDGTALRPAG